MERKINNLKRVVFLSALFLILTASACGGGGSGDIRTDADNPSPDTRFSWVAHWNRVAIDASGLDHKRPAAGDSRVFGEQIGPVRSARAMAIMHIAIADTVAAITGEFESYLPVESVNPETSIKAAVSQAAHDTLVNLWPSQVATFNKHLVDSLAAVEDGKAKTAGIKLGRERAQAILQHRSNDRSGVSEVINPIEYIFSQEPGRWRKDPINPDQPVIGSTARFITPFVMQSAEQFRLPPPPALDSAKYAEDYNEVVRLGGDGVLTPTERTADQTAAGIFWAYDGTPSLCAPPRLYNQIAVQLAQERNYNVSQLARLLAVLNVAMADDAIAGWDSKFFYDVWRPVTAIREADAGTGPTGKGDNNPLTAGDENFIPLGAPLSNASGPNFTPPFPSYPSGHAGFGAAIFQVLREDFGTDEVPFTFVSDEYNGETRDNEGNVRPLHPRSFNNLSEADLENCRSRIYLGIHFDFDCKGGLAQGRQVASYVRDAIYKPLK
jgi:hypothetical protein